MALPSKTIDDFRLGEITEGKEGVLPFGAARRVMNLRVDDFGTLDLIGGQVNLIATRANPVVDFLRYVDPEDTTYRRLLIMEKTGGGAPWTYTVFAINEGTGAATNLGNFQSYFDPVMVQVHRAVYLPASNGTFMYWPGPTFAFESVGIDAPAVAPTVSFNNTGTELNSTNGSGYQYAYTNIDQFGIESNLSPWSSVVNTDTDGGRMDVTIPVDPVVKTTEHGVYRIGGKNRTARRLSVVTKTGSPINLTDSTTDLALSLTQAPTDHDPAPGGFRWTTLHRNRLWGSGLVHSLTGSPSRLWYSAAGGFHYWPEINDGSASSGGYLALDDNPEDFIITASSLDNLLVVHRKSSVYLVYGDRPDNFNPIRRNVPGTIAPRSVVRFENGNFRLTSQAEVVFFRPEGDELLSHPIRRALKAVPTNLMPYAAGAYFNSEYHLHIPNPGGTPYVFVFDRKNNSWREGADANDKLNHAVQFRVQTGTDDRDEKLLFAPASGYVDAAGNAYNGVVQAETTDTPNRVIEWLSDNFNFGVDDRLTAIDSIRIEGDLQGPGTAPVPAITLTTTKKDNNSTVSYSKNLVLNSAVPHDREPPLDMVGIKHKIRIYGKVTAARIRNIIIRYRILGPIKR